MTVVEALKLGVGIATGIVIAYWAGRLLQSLLAGVQPWDVQTLVAAVAVALFMTFAGSLLPALRAARIDPATAMRE